MSGSIVTALKLTTADGTLDHPRICIDHDGIISSIDAGDAGADDTTLTSAFLDIHVHGAAGCDAMEGTPQALNTIGGYLATRGVSHFLATTVTAPIQDTLRALEGIADAIDAAASESARFSARPVGIHLEGPFISHAKRGVHPATEIQSPSIPLFTRMQEAARGHIRLLTIAPETAGALELIQFATESGVRVSLGHSDATTAETRAGISRGAISATHTFNAMRRLDHREPGIAGVVLDSAEVYAELICDGIHVAPEFVRLWLKEKGEGRGILVTDGISATGMPDGDYMLGSLEVTVAEGRCFSRVDLASGVETLAGSVLTMDRAVANLQRIAGASLATAVRLASANPARMLGLDSLCEIAVGRPANFNVFSADGALRETILRGRNVASRRG